MADGQCPLSGVPDQWTLVKPSRMPTPTGTHISETQQILLVPAKSGETRRKAATVISSVAATVKLDGGGRSSVGGGDREVLGGGPRRRSSTVLDDGA